MLKKGPTVRTESNRISGKRGCAIKQVDRSHKTQRGSSKQHQLFNRLGVDVPNKGKVSENISQPIIQIKFLRSSNFIFSHTSKKTEISFDVCHFVIYSHTVVLHILISNVDNMMHFIQIC